MSELPHVVIVGGGFGGLWAARGLATAPVRVTLVDRCNHHLFQPLLYQVATAGLSSPDIAAPLRHILRGQRNATVLMDEVARVDADGKAVELAGGGRLAYDYLVLATGARHAYFGHDEWAVHAPGLKTLDDALAIRRRILEAFERAESETDVLIVVSKLKKYVRDRSGMNTSDAVTQVLSDHVRELCREAIRQAGQDGRRTVLDRDFTKVLAQLGSVSVQDPASAKGEGNFRSRR